MNETANQLEAEQLELFEREVPIQIDGNLIVQNTDAVGKDIGFIKNKLLEMIVSGEVENDHESLIKVLRSFDKVTTQLV